MRDRRQATEAPGAVLWPAAPWLVASLVGLTFWLSALPAGAQLFSPAFELSDSVYLDEADSSTRAHLERVKAYVADEQWDEVVETLRQVMETQGGKVVPVAPGRFVSVADFCHLQIAALPAEALELYRARVDPLAANWYEQAVAARDADRLQQIVDQLFCSSWGDDALWVLGEIALERGQYATARAAWESLIEQPPTSLDGDQYRQITEHGKLTPDEFELFTKWYQRNTNVEPPLYQLAEAPLDDESRIALVRLWNRLRLPATRLAFPGTTIPLADIRARLALVSILEGNLDRAQGEIAAFAKAYPEAKGTLAGRTLNLAKGLATLLSAAREWEPPRTSDDWPTFAGNFQRDGIAASISEIGGMAWKVPADLGEVIAADLANSRAFSYRRVGEDANALLSYHPVVVGQRVLWSNQRYVFAFDLETGKPAWPGDPSKPRGMIYDNETFDSLSTRPHKGLGVPRFTLTVHDDKVYAQMGSQITSRSLDSPDSQTGQLVCLDLAAEGRLVWRVPVVPTEADRFSFEGPPVVDGSNVYVVMRRSDVRPQVFVACLDAETGQQRWRTLICSAETPGGGQNDEITHNLLTLNEGMLYLNTNLGAIAAVQAHNGRIKWIRLYTRARKASSDGIDRNADHFYRDLSPCVYHQGLIYAAPSDCQWILAVDAATGQIAWDSRLPEDAIHLLGVSRGMLIASGNKLWWLDAAGGKVRAVWSGGSPLGYGRGTIAGDQVLWTTRDALYSFEVKLNGPVPVMRRPPIQLATTYNITGGNLVAASNRLLLATSDKLYAFSTTGAKAETKTKSK